MIYNYHTHTFRCKHADGLEEEYVIRAIENGIKFMGFADHIPLKFEDGFESKYRIPEQEVFQYANEVNRLKEKYKDKIEIKLGFESEYYPELFSKMLEKAISWGAEYLILGQHFYTPEHPNTRTHHTYRCNIDDYESLDRYAKSIVQAIKTKKFSYVCHPDIISVLKDEKRYKDAMRKICLASKEYDIPIEINFLGIRENRIYPNEWCWEVAGEIGCPVTFGFDAHDVKSAFDKESLVKAKALVKKYNLNYIGKPKLLPLK